MVPQPQQPTIASLLRQGVAHHQAGRRAEAENVYRQVLSLHPDHPDALNLLGVLAIESGQTDAGIASIRRAISIAPTIPSYHSNLAAALNALGRFDEAAAAYRAALALNPNDAELHYHLGNVLLSAGQLEQSVEAFDRSIVLRPDFPAAHNDMANALKALGFISQAEEKYRQCLALAPDSPEALSNLSDILREQRRLPESLQAAKKALQIRADFSDAWCNLGNTLKDIGRTTEAIDAYQKAVQLNPASPRIHSNLLYSLLFVSDDPAAIKEAHLEFDRRHCAPLAPHNPHTNDRSPNRPLRIGYVSPDFRLHAIGRTLQPLFAHHDHSQFQIFCYSDTRTLDHVTGFLQSRSDAWIDTQRLSHSQLAHRIEQDRVDILIDLTGHMAANRLLVFARKPAPVQISFGAYPATTGVRAIDYRITDPYLDPPGETEDCNTERLLRLPHSFWCHWPDASDPPVGLLPAQNNGHITFGCLNNPCKISPAALDLFASVLKSVPESHLMLLTFEHPLPQNYFAHELTFRGVDPNRLRLVNPRARREYLDLYNQIDIGLDPIPYNGHMTSCDSLYMGVPVLALGGKTSVGRGGVSLLQNLNLSELIAPTTHSYVAVASQLANDVPNLAQLRRDLRPRLKASPLSDAKGFTWAIERAYREAWVAWCAGA